MDVACNKWNWGFLGGRHAVAAEYCTQHNDTCAGAARQVGGVRGVSAWARSSSASWFWQPHLLRARQQAM